MHGPGLPAGCRHSYPAPDAKFSGQGEAQTTDAVFSVESIFIFNQHVNSNNDARLESHIDST